MKKLLLIPTILFPYTVCICLGYGFISRNFNDLPITVLAIASLVCLALSLICNTIYLIITKNTDPKELLKIALLIKLLHIPTYVLIFIFGAMMGIMFFMTFPIILLLILVDLITLFLSGMISVFAVAKNRRELTTAAVIVLLCQFVFCADIISLFAANHLLRNSI